MRLVRWLSTLRLRIRGLLDRGAMERELDEELKFHLDRQIAENLESGLSPTDARREAIRRFGGLDASKEAVRDTWGLARAEQLAADLRQAWRTLVRNRAFSAVCILTLALGIGGNAAIFRLLDALVLRDLPVTHPEELEVFDSWFSVPMYAELRSRNRVFSDVMARQAVPVNLEVGGGAERGVAELVSGNYFTLLGVGARLGRFFDASVDSVPLAHAEIVISASYWRRRFDSDPGVVGRTLHVDDYDYTVIGVAPAGFSGPDVGTSPDLWVPLTMQPRLFARDLDVLDNTGIAWLQLIGRRRPGVDETQAQQAMTATLREIAAEGRHRLYRHDPAHAAILLRPGRSGDSGMRARLADVLYLLMAIVALVFVIACANIAGLQLVRATSRERELAVRLALGAARGRLIRQLVMESVLLGLLGGGLGLLLARWGLEWAAGVLPATQGTLNLPFSLPTQTNTRVLLVSLVLSVVAGLFFGLIPALLSTRSGLTLALRGARGSSPGRRRVQLRSGLVTAQVTLATLLLSGAGLFLRDLRRVSSLETGLDTDRVLMATISPELSGYTKEQADNLFDDFRTRLGAIPGVEAVAMSQHPLLSGGEYGATLFQPGGDEICPDVVANAVAGDFFRAMGGAIVRGRDFSPADRQGSEPVVIISESTARKCFAGLDPIGLRVKATRRQMVEVIGIARDAKYASVDEAMPEVMYSSLAQATLPIEERTLYVRTQSDPTALRSAVIGTLAALDRSVPVYDIRTFAEQKGQSIARERLTAVLSTLFGFLSMLLAAIGLYGIASWSVERRVREIGIRISLGARSRSVIRAVLRDMMVSVLAGLSMGIPLSLAAGRVAARFRPGIGLADAEWPALAALVLIVAALAAAFLPARRAVRVDPARVLSLD